MRVLFVSAEFPPDTPGGIGSAVASMAGQLALRGHDVHVLSCLHGQADRDEVVDGVHVHRRGTVRPVLNRFGTARRFWTAVSVRKAVRALDLRPDVIEAPEYMAESLLLPRSGPPVVVTLHSPLSIIAAEGGVQLDADGRASDWLESLSARRAALMTSPSAMLADDLRAAGWSGGRPVEIVPNAIDLDRWVTGDRQPTGAHVLAVGRLEARKAPEVLVRAVALLRDRVPDVRLTFIGRTNGLHDGRPYVEHVREVAAQVDLPVELRGEVSRDELPGWYHGARVVALPSRFDNYPMTVLEALACSRPVVCTSRTGLAHLVREADAGGVVPPDDPASLAEALLPHLLDASVADAAGARGRASLERQVREAVDARVASYRRAGATDRHAGSPTTG